MKQISNLTLLGYFASLVYFGIDIYQYWIQYPDTSQFIMNLMMSVLIAGVAFLYNRSLQQLHTLNQLEEYLADDIRQNKK